MRSMAGAGLYRSSALGILRVEEAKHLFDDEDEETKALKKLLLFSKPQSNSIKANKEINSTSNLMGPSVSALNIDIQAALTIDGFSVFQEYQSEEKVSTQKQQDIIPKKHSYFIDKNPNEDSETEVDPNAPIFVDSILNESGVGDDMENMKDIMSYYNLQRQQQEFRQKQESERLQSMVSSSSLMSILNKVKTQTG